MQTDLLNMDLKHMQHPGTFIDGDITDIISKHAAEAEALQQLHPQQQAIIHQQNWLNLFVPKSHGGLQLSLPEGLKIEECIAWADGSTGWAVTLCSGANWFVGFLQPELAQALFSNNKVCLAGSGKATGTAKDLGDVYEVTGYWNYASGAFMATAFTANCVIEKAGELLKNAAGNTLIKSFVLLKNEVTLHPTWKAIGMIATASNSFEVTKLIVPKNRAFIIDSNAAIMDAPLYCYPFQQFAEATLAVNSAGMAMRFLDVCKPATEQMPGNRVTEIHWNASFQQLQKVRTAFYITVQQSWEAHIKQSPAVLGTLLSVSVAGKSLAATSRKIVDELYPYCGLAAANPDNEINRVWRNLHTASQHAILLD